MRAIYRNESVLSPQDNAARGKTLGQIEKSSEICPRHSLLLIKNILPSSPTLRHHRKSQIIHLIQMRRKSKIPDAKIRDEIFSPIIFSSDFSWAILTPKHNFSVGITWSANYEFLYVGNNCPDSSEEEKIACLISSNLPNFPTEFVLTPPQLENWLEHKDYAILLAASISGEIRDILAAKNITLEENYEQRIETETEYIKQLWYLIKHNWVELDFLLRNKFQISCSSPLDLLVRIIQIELNQRFGTCLLPYHVDNPRLLKPAYKYAKRFLKPEDIREQNIEEIKEYNDLLEQLDIEPNSPRSRTLQSLELIAQNNQSVKKDLVLYKKLLKKYYSFLEKFSYSGECQSPTTWYQGLPINGVHSLKAMEKRHHK